MLRPNLYFLIPVFNEEENMEDLLQSLHQVRGELGSYDCRFFLLDDGSTDNTVEKFKNFSERQHLAVEILSLQKNTGPGAAFRMGFNHVIPLMKDQDLVISMEGDNTSRVELIKTMIHRLHTENYDMVLASAYAYGGGFKHTNPLRLFLSQSANTMTRYFLQIYGIHTLSSFFRLHNYQSMQTLKKYYGSNIIHSEGFECMIEMLAKCTHLNLKISEVPMVVDWSRRKGKSKMKVFKTIFKYFELFFKAKTIIFEPAQK